MKRLTQWERNQIYRALGERVEDLEAGHVDNDMAERLKRTMAKIWPYGRQTRPWWARLVMAIRRVLREWAARRAQGGQYYVLAVVKSDQAATILGPYEENDRDNRARKIKRVHGHDVYALDIKHGTPRTWAYDAWFLEEE